MKEVRNRRCKEAVKEKGSVLVEAVKVGLRIKDDY